MGISKREQREAEAAERREAEAAALTNGEASTVTEEDLLTPDEVDAELEAEREKDLVEELPEPEPEIFAQGPADVFVFKSKVDFTQKFGKSGTKQEPDGQGGFTATRSSTAITVRFVDRTAVISEGFAKEFGYTAKQLADIMRKHEQYLKTYCIYQGPGLRLTRAEVDFLKLALRDQKKYGVRVVQGAR